jgi:hypothetical protein
VYLWLQQKEELNGISLGKKQRFNHNQSLTLIYQAISEYVNLNYGERILDPSYIQLYRYDNNQNPIKVTALESLNNQVSLKDVIFDLNILYFD